MSRSPTEKDRLRLAPLPTRTAGSARRPRLAARALLGLVVLAVGPSGPGCRTPALEQRIEALELAADRQAIVQLIDQYAFGLDRGDAALLEAIFLPDAVAEYVGVDTPLNVRLEGVRAILEWLKGTDRGRSPPGHYMATSVVELDGDRAKLYAYQHNRDVSGAGLYTVDAVRTPAGWRIEKLHLDQHTLDPAMHEETNGGDGQGCGGCPSSEKAVE